MSFPHHKCTGLYVCELCNKNFSHSRSDTHTHTNTCHNFAISIEIKSKAVPGSEMCLPVLTRFTMHRVFAPPGKVNNNSAIHQRCFASIVFIKFYPSLVCCHQTTYNEEVILPALLNEIKFCEFRQTLQSAAPFTHLQQEGASSFQAQLLILICQMCVLSPPPF